MLYHCLKDIAKNHPNKPAIIANGKTLSYRQLLKGIECVAAQLNAYDFAAQGVLALLLPNSVDFVLATFAGLATNQIVVPINTRFQREEIEYYLNGSQVTHICYNSQLGNLIDTIAPTYPRFALPLVEDTAIKGSYSPSLPSNADRDLAAIHMYSSGSTGKPKRVTRTQGQLQAEYQALASTVELTENDKILCTIPLYHAHGFCNCLLAALLSGATLVLTTGEFNARDTFRLIDEHGITVYPAVPFMFKAMADSFHAVQPNLTSLRLCFSAGAALPEEVTHSFEKKYGIFVRQLYGTTETGAVAINYDGDVSTLHSVGKPLTGVSIDILDESGNVLDEGKTGQVAVCSPAMTRRYDGLPEITTECFRDGYFLPGDLGLKDAKGHVCIKGRKKLLINVAGNKVDPLDVESVIKIHPKVKDVVVVGKPHPLYGEMVKAVVVAESDCRHEEIVRLCEKHLVGYKVPKLVEFRSEIPRSPVGKILRKYL